METHYGQQNGTSQPVAAAAEGIQKEGQNGPTTPNSELATRLALCRLIERSPMPPSTSAGQIAPFA